MGELRAVIKLAILTVVNGHFIFDEEDEDEGNHKQATILEKIENFAEVTVPQFSDRQFQQHFRMSPTTFEDLLEKLSVVFHNRPDGPGRFPVPMEKQAMIALWCLSNLESFRSVGDRFGISKSTCWDVLYRTCHSILALNQHFGIIAWPTGENALGIIRCFQEISRFKGVPGCIDGSHIKILPPKNYPNSYCNRKSFHSVLLQGVCDNKRLFTHVYAGEPGSIHDNRLFEKSDLYTGMENGDITFPADSHMLGDLAYQLRYCLPVGFKDHGNLTNRQKILI
ncbi:unnamed protein product [Acanthoscelides obtectus]|uniref:DDE Tnp4 domain-containing protein n=1 Tax=Acanthoscelides obtectus TaxID=200917 RepID=A0A9P0Q6E8_ACAOB|nr:unnamed protein product [Acanthoscelides obtectus]CAK1681099.1 Protein ANTAGONIST OF LIKE HETEROCHROMATIN PROTEIN 1 [Acanthoscelides obtectus]